MKKIILSALLLTGISFGVQAQDPIQKCASYEALDKTFDMYPELRHGYEVSLLLQNSIVAEKTDGNDYVIPVVFHILHEYGTENIDDSQVYDAMEVINREFNAQDPDSVDVVAEFQNLIGNGHMEFKLAALDPLGNCTNGIEHIYSHESRTGDSYAKLNQWNRSRYLNIWVVKIVGTPGAAAYATFPAGTDGNGYWVDGVLSGHTYIGSIGTSNTGNESVLTHEIGHYFALPHTFGNSDLINDGPTICNDDGILDTPPTKGWNFCPMGTYPAGWIDCDPAGLLVEDVQNYMEYSYCDRHFTPGQVSVMHNTLNGISGQRNNLWTDSTLMLTGLTNVILPQVPSNDINNLTVPLCAPIADFNSVQKTTCVGDLINFTDASWNAVIDSRLWTFQDGSPATSTSPSPSISFTSPGYKTVTLQSTNAAGTGTETRTEYIYVYPNWADFSGPASINLENHYANWFKVINIEENDAEFKISNTGGIGNSKAFKLNNYKDVTNADLFTNDFFYNNRLGLSVDELITPSFDFRYTTGINVSFKYALATNATDAADVTETLKVYSSRDCGKTWSLKKSIPATQIVTAGFAGFTDFVPTSDNQYQEESFTYIPTSADSKTIFKFVFEASDISSNLFIDDINVTGTLSLTSNVISAMDLNVFPNPTSNGNAINIAYQGQDEAVTFTLRNAQGKEISSETIEATNTSVERTLNGSQNLSAACYFLEISAGGHTTTRKVVVL